MSDHGTLSSQLCPDLSPLPKISLQEADLCKLLSFLVEFNLYIWLNAPKYQNNLSCKTMKPKL